MKKVLTKDKGNGKINPKQIYVQVIITIKLK